jgi:hypothetical protein
MKITSMIKSDIYKINCGSNFKETWALRSIEPFTDWIPVLLESSSVILDVAYNLHMKTNVILYRIQVSHFPHMYGIFMRHAGLEQNFKIGKFLPVTCAHSYMYL